MKLTFLLADSAQTDGNGKVHALGIGWTTTVTPTPPLALIVLIDAQEEESGKLWTIVIDLCDQDGNLVQIPGGDSGQAQTIQVRIDVQFSATELVVPGDPLRSPATVQIGPGMPLVPGRYRFQAHVDGDPDSMVYQEFRVREPVSTEASPPT